MLEAVAAASPLHKLLLNIGRGDGDLTPEHDVLSSQAICFREDLYESHATQRIAKGTYEVLKGDGAALGFHHGRQERQRRRRGFGQELGEPDAVHVGRQVEGHR